MATPTTARRKEKVITERVDIHLAQEHLAVYTKAFSKKKELTAIMEQKITAVREQYSDRIATCDTDMDTEAAYIKAFAQQNPDKFVERKSIELLHGKIGYRIGMPKLDKKKGFSWEAIVDLLKENGGKNYLRTKEEVDKEALIAGRDEEKVLKILTACKMEVVQDETFFIEPSEEEK